MNSNDSMRPLRWYLLLWICLGYLWGFLALWNNGIAADWAVCQQGHGTPARCEQLKQLLRGSVLPSAAEHPQLILPALLVFTLILLLYGVLLWLSFSVTKRRRLWWLCIATQGLLVLSLEFVTPAVDIVVPLSL